MEATSIVALGRNWHGLSIEFIRKVPAISTVLYTMCYTYGYVTHMKENAIHDQDPTPSFYDDILKLNLHSNNKAGRTSMVVCLIVIKLFSVALYDITDLLLLPDVSAFGSSGTEQSKRKSM